MTELKIARSYLLAALLSNTLEAMLWTCKAIPEHRSDPIQQVSPFL